MAKHLAAAPTAADTRGTVVQKVELYAMCGIERPGEWNWLLHTRAHTQT